jgi:hypothetical protein
MNAVSTKVLLRFFPPVCLFAPVYFHLVMPRHVWSPYYVGYEHTRVIMGYVTYYLASYVTKIKPIFGSKKSKPYVQSRL